MAGRENTKAHGYWKNIRVAGNSLPIRGRGPQTGRETLATRLAMAVTLRRVLVVGGAGDAWPGRHRRGDRRKQLGVQPRGQTVAADAKVVLAAPAVAQRGGRRVHQRGNGRERHGNGRERRRSGRARRGNRRERRSAARRILLREIR